MADCLAVNHFILGCRKLIKRFGEHSEIFNLQGHFAALGSHHNAGSLDKIAQVKVTHKLIQLFLPKLINTQEELHLASAIFDVGERELAHVADGSQAPRKRQPKLFGLAGSLAGFESPDGIRVVAVFIRAGWIWLNPVLAQLLHFRQAEVLKFGKVVS